MNGWNPRVSIIRSDETNLNPWRVHLSDGLLLATVGGGGGTTRRRDSVDVDQFCAELRRAVAAAHQLNIEGDDTP